MSEELKRDREMCLDSFGVTNHSRGHHPSTGSAVGGVFRKDSDIYIESHPWFRATGHSSIR